MIRSKIDVPLRVLGSLLVIVGWGVIVYMDVTIGAVLTLLGDLSQTPWLIRNKAWDVVAMLCLLHVVTIHKLAQGLFTSAGF